MTWQIRNMQPEYLMSLRQLYLDARQHTFNWQDISKFRLDDFDTATKDEEILVAVSGNTPIGFVSWWEPDNFIHNLYVDAGYYRQGIGKSLLEHCLTKIGRPAALKCLQQNTPALLFYQSQGWRVHSAGQSDDGNYFLMLFREPSATFHY
ncbi:GNAT family N-acetyltransferase [Spirosoma sp. SC4-14]|uniref:GNAT family N-acetyltransferase n=1 Tax=Spirosoma sp. SC4-14 TaxID=3128900 RepID=UPI0030CD7E9C